MLAARLLPIAAWPGRLERATRCAASAVEFAATIVGVRQLLAQPRPALRDRVRVREDGRDVAQRRPRLREEVQRDREVHLALDQQVVLEDERVERDRDGALDRVLDRHDAELVLAPFDGREDVGDRRERDPLTGREIGLAQQRFLGERAGRSEERDRGHDRAS